MGRKNIKEHGFPAYYGAIPYDNENGGAATTPAFVSNTNCSNGNSNSNIMRWNCLDWPRRTRQTTATTITTTIQAAAVTPSVAACEVLGFRLTLEGSTKHGNNQYTANRL
mmetsp:Transcript_13991/g.29522  ORF Transcript_13991/g.29522 Transcript_13991/m.29522 type:complete len:110 (-) Transcript_13991:37-366(-)